MTKNRPSLRAFIGNVGIAMQRASGVTSPPEYSQVLMAQRAWSPATAIPYAIAYEISPDVYACVSLISRVIASLDLKLTISDGKKSTEITRSKGNALDVWRKANPQQTDFEMVESFVANWLVFGNAYLLKERFRASGGTDETKPGELIPIAAAFMTPIPGPGRTIDHFKYFEHGKEKRYEARDIVFGRFWSSADQVEGLSPLAVARLRYQTQENAARYINEMYKAGGGMQGVFSTKVPLNQEQEEAFLERLQKRFRNVARWFYPQFYASELEWHPTSSTLKDMEFISVAKMTTTEIAKVYAVPSDLIGIDKSGALNAASVESSMLLFFEFGIKMYLRRLERLLDERLWPDFKIGTSDNQFVEGHFDTSKVLVLMKAYLDQAKALREIVGRSFLSPAEAREKTGDPPRDDDGLDEIRDPVPAGALGGDEGDDADESTPTNGNGKGARPRPRPAARVSRESMRDAADLQTERAERRAAWMWREILDEQRDRVAAAAAATAFPQPVRAARVEIPEIEALIALIDDASEREQVETFLKRLVEATGQGAVDVIKAQLVTEAVSFDVQALAVRRFLKEHIDRSIRVPNETTRRQLRIAIADAWQAGAGKAGIERAIEDVFDVRRGNVATIARTEVVPALNFSAIEGYKQTGVVRELVWLTARDDVVRGNKDSDEWFHTEMDGQVVRVGDLWQVPRRGGVPESLRYPGDPQGTPGNIINCRCRVAANVARAKSRRVEGGVRWWYGLEGRVKPTVEPVIVTPAAAKRNGHSRRKVGAL